MRGPWPLLGFLLLYHTCYEHTAAAGVDVASYDSHHAIRSVSLTAAPRDGGGGFDSASNQGEDNPNLDQLWANLRCPVLQYPDWSIKDATFGRAANGSYAVFFSAFYTDEANGVFRCHVVGVRTDDWTTFTAPFMTIDGKAEGGVGACSPNLHCPREDTSSDKCVLTFNTWGDAPGAPNQLYYMESRGGGDLFDWPSRAKPLAPELTRGQRVIDAAVAFDSRGGVRAVGDGNGQAGPGQWVLVYKAGERTADMHTVFAHASSLDGPFSRFGGDGRARFLLADGIVSPLVHENFQLFQTAPITPHIFPNLKTKGQWLLLSSDYGSVPTAGALPRSTWVYRRSAGDWLSWVDGFRLNIPIQAGFNTQDAANAGYLYRAADEEHFHLLFAGSTERQSYHKRGWNRLCLARSANLTTWELPPPR